MSKRNQMLFGIFLMVLLWFGLNMGLIFFNDLLRSESWRSWFYNTDESYPMIRIVQPLLSGVGILYLWAKDENTENTGLAWFGFAFVVLATFIYTLAVPPKQAPSKIPTIICDKHNPKNCREFKLP